MKMLHYQSSNEHDLAMQSLGIHSPLRVETVLEGAEHWQEEAEGDFLMLTKAAFPGPAEVLNQIALLIFH